MAASGAPKFYRCSCYYNRNYYVAKYGKHFAFTADKQEFLEQNKKLLEEIKCKTQNQKSVLFDHLFQEYNRRKGLDKESIERRNKIKAGYVPLHKDVYSLKEEFLHAEFLDLVSHSKEPEASYLSLSKKMKQENTESVFRTSVFKRTFCEKLTEELDHFEMSDFPRGRPNTMNNGGILLGELGFDEGFITPFRENYLDPIAKVLFPEWRGGGLDSHRAFTVKYKEGEDLDLGFHYDNAEVTLNVSLGKDFDDGSLYFGSMRQEYRSPTTTVEVKHRVGEGVVHRGQHMHGAMPISYGERVNMIIWMRSSSIRNKLCPMCDHKPVLLPAVGFGDGFITSIFEPTVQVCDLL